MKTRKDGDFHGRTVSLPEGSPQFWMIQGSYIQKIVFGEKPMFFFKVFGLLGM